MPARPGISGRATRETVSTKEPETGYDESENGMCFCRGPPTAIVIYQAGPTAKEEECVPAGLLFRILSADKVPRELGSQG